MNNLDKYNVMISYVPIHQSGKTIINISGVTQSTNTYDGNYWAASIPELKLNATGLTRQEAYLNIEYLQPDGILDKYKGAKAAYSLFKLDSTYTGACINVRRGMDNATLDIGYSGNNLDVATLEAFCNPNTVIYQSDFTSGNEDLQISRGTATDGETVAGVSDCYKFTIDNTLGSHQAFRAGLEEEQSFTITFDYYIPSTNTDITGILVSTTVYNVTDQWTSVSVTITAVNDIRFRFFAHNGTTTSFTGNGTDVFYLKNIEVTQLTTDAYVTTWYDITNNGHDAVQALAAAQPKIVSSGSIITEYEKPAIYFDGIDDWLNANMNNSQFSQLFVVKNTRQDAAISFSGAVQLNENRYITTDDNINFSNYTGLYTIDNLNIKGYLNGVDETGDATIFTQTFNRLYFGSINGSTGFAVGSLQAVIVYDYNYNQSNNIINIENIINDYFKIY